MSIKLGNTGINKLFLGSTEVTKAYLGDTLVFGSDAVQLFDDISVMYTLRQPPMTTLWTKGVINIRRTSDDVVRFVFFDTNGKISLNSLTSPGSETPTATTLGDWIGSNDGFIHQWVGITADNSVDNNKIAIQLSSILQPKFISSGGIITKNGEPTIDFMNDTRYLDATSNPDIDFGKTFTILTVHNQISTTGSNRILGTSLLGGNRLILIADRRTNRQMAIGVNTSGTKTLTYLAQQNHSDQKLITIIIDNTNFEAFYNGVSQDSVIDLGGYDNGIFEIGAERGGVGSLNGTEQEIIIFPSDKTADLTAIHNDINNYYNIY